MTLTSQMKQVVSLLKKGMVDKDRAKAALTHLAREQQEIDRLYDKAMVMLHDARIRAGL